MTKLSRFRFLREFLFVVTLALLSAPAAAINLDQAKSQGLVKESANGYLTVVKPSSEVNQLVNKINAGRKAEYQKIAKKRGTSLEAVELLAGQKLAK